MLTGSGYEAVWIEQKRRRDAKTVFYASLASGSGMILQYFFVDLRIPLLPEWFWLSFRMSIAVAMLTLAAAIYVAPEQRRFWAKLVFALVGLSAAILQAYGTTLMPQFPLIFAVVIGAFISSVNPIGLVPSCAFLLLTAVCQAEMLSSVLERSTDAAAQYWSLYLVAGGVVFAVKSGNASHVSRFLHDMREIERQRQMISLQTDLATQLRSFLPKVVFERISNYKRNFRTTFEYATQEILRPRSVDVVCIWSDIRGFTQSSRDTRYVEQLAGPNLRHMTDISESCGAIPRLIGDLLLCIFDYPQITTSFLNSLKNAEQLRAANRQRNILSPPHERVDRVFILSFGRAVVGNVGGSSGAREITALGPCVNQLARIDEAIGEIFRRGHTDLRDDILATLDFVSKGRALGFEFEFDEVSLHRRGVMVRDFPDLHSIVRIRRWSFGSEATDFETMQDSEEQKGASVSIREAI